MTDRTLSSIDLARKLGLVRSRKVANFLHPQLSSKTATSLASKNVHMGGPFSFYIVIDFESTCWANKGIGSPEVIEFPAVLYDAKNRTVPDGPSSVFHGYVMPTEEPILSKFCTELTGIDQDKVNSGCPLPTTMYLFKKWIVEITTKYNLCLNELVTGKNPCTFVTWTDWDLKICLENECKRKGISKPRYLDAWIDLKWTYQKFYGRKPKGLNGALKETGLDFDGREHSGICDAKNTAKLLGKMLDDRCVLGITKVINAMKIDPKLKYDDSSLSAVSIKSFLEKHSGKKSVSKPTEVKSAAPSKLSTTSTKIGLKDITNQIETKPTEEVQKRSPFTGVRITPPLCSCGRRAKRLLVSKPGPNQGRNFFSCSIKKSEANRLKNGCNFFKWDEPGLGESPNFINSKSFSANKTSNLPTSSKSFVEISSTKVTLFLSNLPKPGSIGNLLQTETVGEKPVAFPTKVIPSPRQNTDNNTDILPTISKESAQNLAKTNTEASTFVTNSLEATLNLPKQNTNKPTDEHSRRSLPMSRSATTFLANQSVGKFSKSKSVSNLANVDTMRHTLGPSKRYGLLQRPDAADIKTPEMKRARLNFNSPRLKNSTGCVARQYFGNVPLGTI